MSEEQNNLQFDEQNLLFGGQVITFNSGEDTCNDPPEYAPHATDTECGVDRIRRLRVLGYV